MMEDIGLELHSSGVILMPILQVNQLVKICVYFKITTFGNSYGTNFKISTPQTPEYKPIQSENNRFTVVNVDPSQEHAVMHSRLKPGIVIEGPPGTGKSQTIVNIISDCIGRKEKY